MRRRRPARPGGHPPGQGARDEPDGRPKDGRHLGSVTTLRDRTELAHLEREIGSFRSSTELLRAQAHEFANQLHTISGLIQIGEYDEVVRYVDAVSRHRESLDLTVNRRVRDSAVAALLMAKSSLAAERRVELGSRSDTSLERLEPADSADVATVVGNLVDNAIDAAVRLARTRWVEVALHQDATAVEIVVRDSGPGVAPELAQEVFTHGFTTKAAQAGERGIGLALTRLVCQRRGGEVSVANTEDGAMFTAQLTVDRRPRRRVPMIRVLVVDDDFMVARIHRGFVERVPGSRSSARATPGAGARRGRPSCSPTWCCSTSTCRTSSAST